MNDPPLSIGAWLRYDFIRKHLDRAQPTSVLEFGPGLGAMGVRLAKVATYEAVEPDPESRERARAALGDRVKGSIADVSLGPAGMICAFEVLEHVENDAETLALWLELLAPGGVALFSVPAFEGQYGPHDLLAGHLRRYSPDQLETLLIRSGLRVLDVRVTGFPIGFALQWARNRLARRRAKTADPVATVRTHASGRLYQFESQGWLTAVLSWPFRQIQRLPTGRGTGLVIAAVKPE